MWFDIIKQYGAISAFGETFRPNTHTDSKLPVEITMFDLTQNEKKVYQENYNTVPEAFNRIKKLANNINFKVQGNDSNGHLISNQNPNIKVKYWIREEGELLFRPHDKTKNNL